MKKLSISVIILLCCAFFILSCKKSENTTPPSNQQPTTPSSPIPADAATNVSITPVLSWTCSDPDAGDSLKFDIYFGSINPPNTLLVSNWKQPNYALTTLDFNKLYYWRVTAHDLKGASAVGPIWRFTTMTELPSQGLVAYYPFNGNANDESGNGWNGTVNGATLTTDRYGNTNSAYSFSGSNKSITTNYPGILGGNPRTVSLWVQSNISTAQNFVSWGTSLPYNNFVCAANYPSNPAGVQCAIGWSYVLYSANINDGSWHHVVYIVPNITAPKMSDVICYYDGTKLTTVGGSYELSAIINTIHDPSWNLKIGEETINSNFSIDAVRVYNRELSSSEVNALYNE